MTAALVEWLQANASRMRTLDPDDDDFTDLEPLREIVGDARVVALGESVHGVREFYLYKHRFLRFLVQEMGFTAWVMESGLPEGLGTNAWVLGALGEVGEMSKSGVTYFMGACREFEQQLEWMRAFNQSHTSPVRFWGMDLPADSASPVPALGAALDVLGDADPAYAAALRAQLLPLLDFVPPRATPSFQLKAMAAYAALSSAHRNEITARIADMCERLQALALVYAERTSSERAELAVRCARVAQQLDATIRTTVEATSAYDVANLRDAAMAENLLWILDREDRVVVSGHNAHLQRAPFGGPPMTMLGQHLAAALGDHYRAIGTTYGSGTIIQHAVGPDGLASNLQEVPAASSDVLDGVLAASGLDQFVLDLRRVPTTGAVAEQFREVTRMRANATPAPVDLRQAFDAIVHIERVGCYSSTHPELAHLWAAS